MSLDNDSEVHQQFTEADILASYIGNDSDSDSEDDDAIEIMGKTPVVSLDEKINGLQVAIEVLNENSFENFHEIKKLRRILNSFCNERVEQRLGSLKQVDIRSYFG